MTETPAPHPDVLQRAVNDAAELAGNAAYFSAEDQLRYDAMRWLASALPALLAAQADTRVLRSIDNGNIWLGELGWHASGEQHRVFDSPREAFAAFTERLAAPLPCSESTDTNG